MVRRSAIPISMCRVFPPTYAQLEKEAPAPELSGGVASRGYFTSLATERWTDSGRERGRLGRAHPDEPHRAPLEGLACQARSSERLLVGHQPRGLALRPADGRRGQSGRDRAREPRG